MVERFDARCKHCGVCRFTSDIMVGCKMSLDEAREELSPVGFSKWFEYQFPGKVYTPHKKISSGVAIDEW